MKKRFRAEKRIEKRVCERALLELQVPQVGLKLLLGGHNGWPDRAFLVGHNRVLLIEFKDPEEGEVSAIQDYIHTMLRGLGYDVQVHDNEEQAIEAIARAKVEAAQISEGGHELPAGKRGKHRAARPRSR
jgi:hypothetical protein